MKIWIVTLGLLLTPCVCAADLLPPTPEQRKSTEEANARANRGEYERADQFCAGKSVGKGCLLPGTPFEGGGRGVCVTSVTGRYVNGKDVHQVEAICLRRNYSGDDGMAQIPPPPRLPAYLCGPGGVSTPEKAAYAKAIIDALREARNITPTCQNELRHDRYCAGKTAGDPCSVEMAPAGETATDRFDGVCTVQTMQTGDYIGKPDNRFVAWESDYLACRTPNLEKAEMRPASPPGFLGKLFED